MEPLLIWLIIFLSIAILILIIIVILLYVFRRRFTRERFAFFALWCAISMASLIFVPMAFSHNVITLFFSAGNIFFDLSLTTPPPGIAEQILAGLMFLAFANLIGKIHRNWDGAISIREHELRRLSDNSGMIQNGVIQAKDFFLKEKLIVKYAEDEEPDSKSIFTTAAEEQKSWHEDVSEILVLISKQYKIDVQQDWYSEYSCFLSEYGKNNDFIAIYCVHEEPEKASLQKVLEFVQSQNKHAKKLIIAIKNGELDKRKEKHGSITLEFRYESELLNWIADFSDYENYIHHQFLSTEITIGTGLTLNDIYIELSARTDEEKQIEKTENFIHEWLNNSTATNHLAILGEYGQGKSVLSLKLAHELLEQRASTSRIPILIELRGKSPRNLNRLEILSNWASNFGVDPKAILKLHHAGRLLLIFEGFDEMDMVGDQEIRLNHFESLWKFANPKSKIIITGRPNFFLDDRELKVALGIHEPVENLPYCEAIYLNSFSMEQIEIALRNIKGSTRDQILDLLKSETKSSFYDLISRPSILHLVGVIWEERKLANYKEKINSAFIISEFIQYSYTRQTLKGVDFLLTEREREYFMIGVAVGMLRNTIFSNQIHKDELNKVILELYKEFPEEVSKSQSALLPSERKPLKDRMHGNPFAKESILTDVRSCGILVTDLTRTGYFRFAHKSFMEFLVSFFYTETLIKDKGYFNIVVNSINKAIAVPFATAINTRETTAFIAQILLSKLELSQTDDKKMNCQKLFEILFPNKILGRFPKLAIILSIFTSPRMLMYISLPLVLLSSLLTAFNLSVFEVNFGSNLLDLMQIILAVSFTVTIIPMYYVLVRRRISERAMIDGILGIGNFYGYQRLAIWLECCYELDIQDDTIREVIPNYGLQAIKNNDPMYFVVLMFAIIKRKIVPRQKI